jgi:anthranilate phosphoribosyltransferase
MTTPSDFDDDATSVEATEAGRYRISWALRGDGPEASAAMIRDIFAGQNRGPARDIVVLNAAAAIWTAGKESDQRACAQLAADAIDTGAAKALLARLAELSAGK